jgi:protein-ribulosamine 3-kinase
MIPEAVHEWCLANGLGVISSSRPVGGGCINSGAVLLTASGVSLFLKTNRSTPPDMFRREAEGLDALRQPDGPVIPEVYLAGDGFILLQDLNPGARTRDYWTLFGQQLAALHMHTHEKFGFEHYNYIGSTPQPNGWEADGFRFFAEKRLLFQAELARERRYLSAQEVHRVERLAARLPQLLPAQPASLIHGDLWSGNATTNDQGVPALIDPAAHYGWAEAELGMTALFGGFPAVFYDAYQEVRPLPAGLQQRLPLYNLYHLLNHLNLFGSGYYGQVTGILHRYGA